MPEPRTGGLDHIGVTVGNIERSLAFYVGLLGLEVIEVSDGHTGHVVGLPDARMRIADLALADGRLVELVEYTAGSSAQREQAPNAVGQQHVGLRVADLDATVTALAAAGHLPLGEPMFVASGLAWAGARVAYFEDPDGALVELVQRPAGRDAE